jgi:hypothetical protein
MDNFNESKMILKNSTYLNHETPSIQSTPQTLDSIVQGRTVSDFRIWAHSLYRNKTVDCSLYRPWSVHV